MPSPAVRALLHGTSLGAYLAGRPPCTVVTLSSDTPLPTALKLLANRGITSAPVFDEADGTLLLGFFSLDHLVAALVDACLSTPPGRQLQDHLGPAAYKLGTAAVGDVHLSNDTKLLYSAHTSSSLWDVVELAFVHPQDGLRSHRVAVFEPDEDGLLAEAEDGQARLRITGVVSQTDVLAYLHRNQGQIPGLWATPVAALGLGQRPVVSVPSDMPTIHAFAAMASSGVRAVGVVDAHGGHGRLVGSLSPADLRGMLPEDAALLALPVLAFVRHAAQGADGWAAMRSLASLYGVKSPELQPADGGGAPVVACAPESTFGEVAEALVSHRIHRVYLWDPEQRPVGVVSVSDLFQCIAC